MNLAQAESIAKAVLFEGYMLYPYRPSSVKNRQRWTFGGIYPQAYSEALAGSDPWSMQTQCLAQGNPQTSVTVRIGFLHLIEREVGELPQTLPAWPEDTEPEFRKVSLIEIGERRYYAWQEAVEREVVVGELRLGDLAAGPLQIPFAFSGRRDLEPLRDQNGGIAGVLIRTQQPIEGRIELAAEAVAEQVFRITVRILNQTTLNQAADLSRNAASLHALVSTHTILGLNEGDFVSSLDPPEALRDAVNACQNVGAWPVLVGAEGERDTMLCSPIILYDYPEIAPESPGDLFDGTEIDEILTLRILAMTDEEKREMAAVDERARALLERTEALSPQALNRLHGTLRSLRRIASQAKSDAPPWEALDSKPRLAYLRVGGVDLRVGDHVRLCPRAGADILDIALGGKTATIQAIERDFEDRVHVAVVVDDDPGKEFGLERMPGHRFFFSPEEVEPLTKWSTAVNVLIAGIGNIFLGDDGFGSEVAQRMSRRDLPQGVRVVDFGIRGLDLSYALVDDGFDAAILVDTTRQGDAPGTLYVIEPEMQESADFQKDSLISPHDMDAGKVLRTVKAIGGHCERIVLVGCEPESFGEDTDEQGRMGLSGPVAAAVDRAVVLIESLVSQLINGGKVEALH